MVIVEDNKHIQEFNDNFEISGLQTPYEESSFAVAGISRRSFVKLVVMISASLGISTFYHPQVAQALEESVIGAQSGDLFPVIWMQGAACSGCTNSFLSSVELDAASLILEMISLNYHIFLSAGADENLELARMQTLESGNYICIQEGALLKNWEGNAVRSSGSTFTNQLLDQVEEGEIIQKGVYQNARAIIALGSCAVNGGWLAAPPNPTNAIGVEQFLHESRLTDIPVINIPGCPANPDWLISVLSQVVLLRYSVSKLQLTFDNKPEEVFNQTIHDNCERRGHFENGEFVFSFGSKEEEKGYCLYTMGCRGPQTKANCGVVRFNNKRSWCVASGGPCIGCCEATPNRPHQNWVQLNAPFYSRNRDLRIGKLFINPDIIAFGVTGIVATALVIHGFGMKKAGRTSSGLGAPFENSREWDREHPNESIGQYPDEILKKELNKKNPSSEWIQTEENKITGEDRP